MTRIRTIILFLILGLLLGSAAYAKTNTSSRFTPPQGQVLLIVGQDKVAIKDYVASTGIVPGGIMFYTSVQLAQGMQLAADYGGGVQDGQFLVDQYPNSVLQIGLWMVDACGGIIKGEYYKNLDVIGSWIKKSRRPVYLRIGYEFDLPNNHYDPKEYVLAFRYIVDRFRKNQINNVAYVWHSYANYPQHPWEQWYPGDDYVNWFALSVFGKPNSYMTKFAKMAQEHQKSLMIAESTPQGIGTIKGEVSWNWWFKDFFQFIVNNNVKIVSYINCDWESIPMFKGQGWGETRIQVNETVKKKWLSEIHDKKYLQASSKLFKRLGFKN